MKQNTGVTDVLVVANQQETALLGQLLHTLCADPHLQHLDQRLDTGHHDSAVKGAVMLLGLFHIHQSTEDHQNHKSRQSQSQKNTCHQHRQHHPGKIQTVPEEARQEKGSTGNEAKQHTFPPF